MASGGGDLTPVAAHLGRVLALGPLGEVVQLPTTSSLGLRLAAAVTAPRALPAFASSALDGYAVRVADVPGSLEVLGEVAAGAVSDLAVAPGRAVRIMTGGVIPAGTEAVVGVEVANERGGRVTLTGSTAAGAAMRPAGSDVAQGATVVEAGQRIGPAQIAALLSTGHVTVGVHRRPRVLVVSTGDELVAPGSTPGPAQLIDSNRPALLAAVAAAGGEPVDGGLAGDEPAELLRRLAVADVDLVLTSGGVSMGTRDVVKLALRPLGVAFDRVAMQPGMPQAWGRPDLGHGPVPFIGLPGNPVSALLSFGIFVRPLLGAPLRPGRRSTTSPITGSPVAKVQYLRGRLGVDDGCVTPVGGAGSHLLVTLAAADALIVVPVGVSDLPAGSEVDVLELEATWS